jgi:hypothetical protein
MLDLEDLIKLSEKIKIEISAYYPDLLSQFPVNKYIDFLERYPELGGYKYISPDVEKLCSDIIVHSNKVSLELFHKLLLIHLIMKSVEKLRIKRLPERIKSLYVTNFKRIVDSIKFDTESPGFYLYPNDAFFKDLSVCCFRMIPAGARKLTLMRLPIRVLFGTRVMRYIGTGKFLLIKCKKRIYYLLGHLDTHDPQCMAEFSLEGHIRFFNTVAKIMEMDETMMGWVGNSWFYDPKLEKISPKLAYLRRIPLENGARDFYRGTNDSAKKHALVKSPTRKRLFKEGKYLPVNYMIIWPRRELLEWADQTNL